MGAGLAGWAGVVVGDGVVVVDAVAGGGAWGEGEAVAAGLGPDVVLDHLGVLVGVDAAALREVEDRGEGDVGVAEDLVELARLKAAAVVESLGVGDDLLLVVGCDSVLELKQRYATIIVWGSLVLTDALFCCRKGTRIDIAAKNTRAWKDLLDIEAFPTFATTERQNFLRFDSLT